MQGLVIKIHPIKTTRNGSKGGASHAFFTVNKNQSTSSVGQSPQTSDNKHLPTNKT
jgi:hypothetical protein